MFNFSISAIQTVHGDPLSLQRTDSTDPMMSTMVVDVDGLRSGDDDSVSVLSMDEVCS